MERFSRHIPVVAAVIIMSSGCADNHLDDVRTDRDFCFHVAVTPCTKAVNGHEYPSDVPFGVWSCEEDGTPYLVNERICFEAEDGWVPETAKTWDGEVDRMDFIACSPYGRGEYDRDKGICFDAYDIEEGHDLMYCDPLTGQDRETSQAVVHVNMKRALTFVRFKAKVVVPEPTQIVVRRVDVGGVSAEGSFRSLPEASWMSWSDPRNFCFFEGTEELGGEPAALGEGLFMIPQASEIDVNVLCDIITGDVALRDQTLGTRMSVIWKAGKIASYIIRIDGHLDVTLEKDNE